MCHCSTQSQTLYWFTLWQVQFYDSSNILRTLKDPEVQAARILQKYARLKHTTAAKSFFFYFIFYGAYSTEYHRERGGINLVILREGTINVSAVNCFGDATALGGCYHRDKSAHRSTVHAHAKPAIAGGTRVTSHFLWTLIWLCWTCDWSDWRLEWSFC